jgi:hypothetical protein
MGAAFFGRDTWRYSVVAVLAGSVLVVLGALASRRYLGAIISRRGVLRRRQAVTRAERSATKPQDRSANV